MHSRQFPAFTPSVAASRAGPRKLAVGVARRGLKAWRIVLGTSCFFLCAAALAQAREVHENGYTLRSSTVRSTALSPATAAAHGILPAADRAVLNVVVQRQAAGALDNNVPARVSAVARNMLGLEREVPMRPAKAANGEVSYFGTYDFASREVLDFRVKARPEGSRTDLELAYRERMPAVTD